MNGTMETYRPEFLEALNLLAAACEEVVSAGHPRPVLVGGAVVEFYTGSEVTSGDFDVVTPVHQELEQALLRRGFQRPSGQNVLLRGLLHPQLQIGVEFVSGVLFDGASDRTRVRVISLASGGMAMPPVEDMIADRMSQYHSNPPGCREMLEQAIALYKIAISSLENPLDMEYLNHRIRHETMGDYDLRFLTEKADGTDYS